MDLRDQLPPKEINYSDWELKYPDYIDKCNRVLAFDPTDVYSRITIDPYKRIHSIPISEMFPDIEGSCACGCGKPPRRRWARSLRFLERILIILTLHHFLEHLHQRLLGLLLGSTS